MQSRILFVDDDPFIRELYHTIGSDLGGYEVHTAAGAEEALELIQQKPFQVIVSDLTMAGMDGIQLMGAVLKVQPEIARIIVSGYSEGLKVAQGLMVGHRYFAKPFDVEMLVGLLNRLCHYRHLISNGKVRRVIGGLGALPTPPETYLRLTEALNSPYSSMEDIAEIVQQDPGVVAKLLQVVNSVQFGMAQRVMDPMEAVQIAGLEIVRALMLGVQAFGSYNQTASKAGLKGLWEHSLKTALAARKLAKFERLSREGCDQAFLGGLLHDIGKLILASNAAEEYQQIIGVSAHLSRPLIEVEERHFGSNHAQIGAYLLALWGLPDSVVKIVETHHAPSFVEGEGFSAATAVHVAQGIDTTEKAAHDLDLEYLKKLGMDQQIEVWKSVLLS